MKKGEEKERIWIYVPPRLLEKIDILVQKGYYRDRQDFIIDAMRHRIEEYEEKRPELFNEP